MTEQAVYENSIMKSADYRKKNIAKIIIITILILFYLLLFSLTSLYADDYLYGTFTKNGFISFVKNNIDHYKEFNGRIIVHIIIEVILINKNLLFPIANSSMIILILITAKNVFNIKNYLNFYIICGTAILLIDVSVLKESLLWTSASFNYTYPTLMLVLSILALKNIFYNNIKIIYILALFFAGATTEQIGLVILLTTILFYFIEKHIKYNVINIKNLILILTIVLAGYLTVILSPATLMRLGRENSYGIENLGGKLNPWDLYLRLKSLSLLIIKPDSAGVISFLLLFSFGLLPLTKLKFQKIYYVCIPLSILQLILSYYVNNIIVVLFIINLAMQIITIYNLLKTDILYYNGYILFSAILSIIILLATDSIFPRTVFPYSLLCILVISNIFINIITTIKNSILFKNLIQICAIICIIINIPTLTGYYNNLKLSNLNVRSLKSPINNIAVYNWDFNDNYKHDMMHDEGYFYHTYLKYYYIDDDIKIKFEGNNCPEIAINNNYLVSPVIFVNGFAYAPIELIIEALDGQVLYNKDYTIYNLNSISYYLDNRSFIITRETDNIKYDLQGNKIHKVYLYLKLNLLYEIFNIRYYNHDTYFEIIK